MESLFGGTSKMLDKEIKILDKLKERKNKELEIKM